MALMNSNTTMATTFVVGFIVGFAVCYFFV
jgi:hypothetical protein